MMLESRLLPVPHGFATRLGGESQGPYASLNLGFSVGDERAAVERNVKRFCERLEIPASALHRVSQVHGERIAEVPPPPSLVTNMSANTATLSQVLGEADALWSAQPQSAVAVSTADCVPILLVAPNQHWVAAVHSGWKGTSLEIVRRMVEQWAQRGASPETLLVAVGPSIRACCYEVSDALAQQFRQQFGADVVRTGPVGKPHLDLVKVVQHSLASAGVKGSHVDVLPQCTACDATQFFSHRRDRGLTGRHLSAVVCRF